MRYRFAHALVFLVGLLAGWTTAHAQALDVIAEPLTAAVDAQPRQTVNLQVRFTNAGAAWRTVEPMLSVPGGWVVVVPPGEVTLAPGEIRLALFTVLVGPDAAAGTYTFPMTYGTAAGTPPTEVWFTVRVPAIDQVVLTLDDAPAFIASAAPHRVEFLLHNTGNTAHEWDLTASSSLRLPVDLTPSVVTLGPGERAPVVALVAAPERVTQQQTHTLTVTATSRALPDVRATARAAVLLVPTSLPAASALHTFPLTIRTTVLGNLPMAAEAHPRFAIEVTGRGTISDRDPGLLGLSVRMTSANAFERITLEYQRPTWGVRFGHQDFVPSPLSSSVSAFGVSASATWPLGVGDQLRAELATYLVNGEARLALAATATLPHGTQLAATLGFGSSALLGTLGVRYAPEQRDPSTLQVTAVEATFGVRAEGDAGFAQALRVAAQVNGGPSFARVMYDTAAATFDGRDEHGASLRVAAALRLNDAFSIRARFPIDLTVGYDRTWAWDAGGAYRLLPPQGAPDQEQRYRVGVSAVLGPASVNASYALTSTKPAIHGTEHELRALVRSRITDDFTVTYSGVWTRRQLLGAVPDDALELQTVAALRIGDGLLTTSVTMARDLDAGRTSGTAFGVKWAGEPVPDLWLSVDATLHLLDPEKLWDAGLDVRVPLGELRVLTTKVTAQARVDRPVALTFEVGLAVPLRIPLGRRSDIGCLQGSITRADGRGLPGVVVTVAGQAVTTTTDGAFRFPALPVGEHSVHVVASDWLGATEYLTPDLPAAVLIGDDATTELHFVVHEAATVAGRIATVAVDPTDGRTAIAPEGSGDALVRGIRIELRSGATTLHTVTDASGAFRFQRVPAGDWTLQVPLPRTAAEYRIDPPEVRLVLAPGGDEVVLLRLVPIVRQIQFDDGGTLEPQDAP